MSDFKHCRFLSTEGCSPLSRALSLSGNKRKNYYMITIQGEDVNFGVIGHEPLQCLLLISGFS